MKLSATGRRNLVLGLLTLLTLAKGAVWMGVTPMFLVADEPAHFDNVQFRAEHHAAPHYDNGGKRIDKVMHEGASPEVRKLWFATIPKHYYARGHAIETLDRDLVALAASPVGRDTDGQAPAIDYPGLYYNLALPAYLAFRSSSVVTRIMAIRFVSLLLGLCAVLCTYFAARFVVTDELLCFVAASLVALQPMESQMTAAVNNDAGVIGFAALLFYFQVRALAELPRFPSPTVITGLLVSAVAIVMTKPTGFGILPGVGVVALAVLITFRRSRPVIIAYAILAALGLAIVATRWPRIVSLLPGDSSQLGQYGHPDFDSFLQSLDQSYVDYLVRSTWGQFGWLDFSIHANWMPRLRAVVPFLEIGTVVAFATHALRSDERPFWLRGSLLGFCMGTVLVGVAFILYVEHRFRLTGIVGVIQGRNFLFVLPAFAIWLTVAVCALVPQRLRTLSAAFLFLGAFLFNAASLFTIVYHHYVR